MIVPPKATKGRRMSKKTRKKSTKASSGKPARVQSKTSAKSPPSKTRRATASKSGKKLTNAMKPIAAKASTRESHKPPSKQLKSERPETPAARQSVLTEGARAPAFRLPRDGGDTVSLSDYSGRKLVLFFYPRADTPGCTKEAIDFTRLAGAFAESQTAVLGVSADPQKTQESFRDKHRLTIPLVSDEKHEMLDAYGVWGEKSMYGRTFLGILRTTVLIGADGRIAKIWRNVRVDGHADEVLAAARAL
jgi:thioredoxin-dependent peroxiredoxin